MYKRQIQGVPRDIFTIAHEIGHAILHDDIEEIALARNDEEIKPFENPEWQANTCLLYTSRLHLAKTNVKDVVGWDDENGRTVIEVNSKYEPNRIIIERKQT